MDFSNICPLCKLPLVSFSQRESYCKSCGRTWTPERLDMRENLLNVFNSRVEPPPEQEVYSDEEYKKDYACWVDSRKNLSSND